MTTDQLRERVAKLADRIGAPGFGRIYVTASDAEDLRALLALLSPSPRGDEGDLAYVASDGAAVSLKRTPPAEPAGPRGQHYTAIGILNPYGDLWSPDVFKTIEEAAAHVKDFWRGVKPRPRAVRDLNVFKIVPVSVTVTVLDTTDLRAPAGVLLGDTGTAATQRYDPPLPAGTGLDRAGEALERAFDDVRAFHVAFSVPAPGRPTMLEDSFARRRADWIEEEAQELREATTTAAQADAFIDAIYFAVGGLVEMGIRPSPIWNIVQAANMSKLWEDGKPRFRDGDGKIVKPPTWIDPDPLIVAEVARQTDVPAPSTTTPYEQER